MTDSGSLTTREREYAVEMRCRETWTVIVRAKNAKEAVQKARDQQWIQTFQHDDREITRIGPARRED